MATASSSARSRENPPAESAIAAPTPAITQAELEPSPPESGMGERIVMCSGTASVPSREQASR